MMDIDLQVKRLIEQNIDLIESNEFALLYMKAFEDEDPFFNTNQLTRVFWESGIDPLKYMQHIPPQFLWADKELKEYVCPSHIQSIGAYAFNCCDELHHVVINDGCEIIDEMAFANCHRLKYVVVPDSVHSIDPSAFERNHKYFCIICNENSYAHKHAEQCGYKWMSIDTYKEYIQNGHVVI